MANESTPTAWDLQILDELKQEIVDILDAIGALGPSDTVRLPYGDSRPMPVLQAKKLVDRKRDESRAIMRQFPEYFAL